MRESCHRWVLNQILAHSLGAISSTLMDQLISEKLPLRVQTRGGEWVSAAATTHRVFSKFQSCKHTTWDLPAPLLTYQTHNTAPRSTCIFHRVGSQSSQYADREVAYQTNPILQKSPDTSVAHNPPPPSLPPSHHRPRKAGRIFSDTHSQILGIWSKVHIETSKGKNFYCRQVYLRRQVLYGFKPQPPHHLTSALRKHIRAKPGLFAGKLLVSTWKFDVNSAQIHESMTPGLLREGLFL